LQQILSTNPLLALLPATVLEGEESNQSRGGSIVQSRAGQGESAEEGGEMITAQ